MKTIEQIKIRLATLKTLENYYRGLLSSKYTKKQLDKIIKEQYKLRILLNQKGENSIH